MRIFTLILLLLAAPAALHAQQGPRRGPAVPARAVQEASAARAANSKEAQAARVARERSRVQATNRPSRPAARN